MPISEIIELTKLLSELLTKKQQLDKSIFDNFVHPTWTAFQSVHKDYIDSIKNYSSKTTDSSYPTDELIQEIYRDSLQTQNLRIDLVNLTGSLDSLQKKLYKSSISNFISAIENYFYMSRGFEISLSEYPETLEIYCYRWSAAVREYEYLFGANIMRIPILVYLSKAGKDVPQMTRDFVAIDRYNASRVFDGMTEDLQLRYGKVSSSYYQLRTTILT